MTTQIIGTGSCLPSTVVTNDFLSTIMDTSDEWIVSRTGIKERHLVKTETTGSMAIEAAQRALQQAGIEGEQLDLIIVGTITADYVTPSCACQIQAELGAKNAVAFDINAACSGFMFAMNTAHIYLQSGIYKTALVLGVESLSKIMDWSDRSTCVLFGDGAGAAVLKSGENGLLAFDQGSDGAKGMVLQCKNRENKNPLLTDVQNEAPKELGYVQMEGQEVYKFAVTTVPKSIEKVLQQAGLQTTDITYFLLHQANVRIIQSVAKRLKVSEDKFPINLDHCGNISAASVPILLDELNRQGKIKKGDKIVMSGFGAGLTWGSSVIEWM